MATIIKEISIEADADKVWDVVRDYGRVERLVPGALVSCVIEGNARIVTFRDGRVARELLVGIEDSARRLAYAEPDARFITRNASMQVLPDGEDKSRLVWIQDVLPDEHAALVAGNMDRALPLIKRTMEAAP